METGRHVVFYREDARGILISRILHERMLPERHVIDDEDKTNPAISTTPPAPSPTAAQLLREYAAAS